MPTPLDFRFSKKRRQHLAKVSLWGAIYISVSNNLGARFNSSCIRPSEDSAIARHDLAGVNLDCPTERGTFKLR